MTVATTADVSTALDHARARTTAILEPVPDGDQRRQVSPLMSPLCWDLAHIGHYEELWLLRELAGAPPTDARFDDIYDAFKHPRRDRPNLPILEPAAARRYVADVRARVQESLGQVTPADARTEALLDGGFVYGMVVQHEHQHDETLLATLQLLETFAHPMADGRAPHPTPARTGALRSEVLVDGGRHVVGTSDAPWAYDNERPQHTVELAPYFVDTTPVTNRAYAAFVADGGYDDERLWDDDGWAWRRDADLVAPQFWHREGGDDWSRVRYGRREAVPPDEPVQHVCWYEAAAYARWAGRRLPTEVEWEVAAHGAHPSDLWHDGRRFAPRVVGLDPSTASDHGVHDLFGGVWEWTASTFAAYPGFRSFPYPEYSEVFFGSEYRVLRGGSWATDAAAMRTTFRNWDFPIRRQIFAGFRCARDA